MIFGGVAAVTVGRAVTFQRFAGRVLLPGRRGEVTPSRLTGGAPTTVVIEVRVPARPDRANGEP
jgi:hypothetical protein